MFIPNIWKNKIHVPNHQPEYQCSHKCVVICIGSRAQCRIHREHLQSHGIARVLKLGKSTWRLRCPVAGLFLFHWTSKKGCAKAPGNDIFLRKMELLIPAIQFGIEWSWKMWSAHLICHQPNSGQLWTASQSSPGNPVLIPASHGWKLRQGQRPLPQLRQWIHQCLGFLAMEARIKMGEIHNWIFFLKLPSGYVKIAIENGHL